MKSMLAINPRDLRANSFPHVGKKGRTEWMKSKPRVSIAKRPTNAILSLFVNYEFMQCKKECLSPSACICPLKTAILDFIIFSQS